MRNVLLVGWLVLPIAAWAYHEGPGQDRLALERCDERIVDARAAFDNGDYRAAIAGYEAALGELPDGDEPLAQRLRLELAKARIENRGLVEAREDLEILVDQLLADEHRDEAVLAGARAALARSQFYVTWLMRLEGVTREQWEPEIEAARQNWRLLAETAGTAAEQAQHLKDLEAAIRLGRLAIEDLQGLPLPSQ
jgi:hypothetical protein